MSEQERIMSKEQIRARITALRAQRREIVAQIEPMDDEERSLLAELRRRGKKRPERVWGEYPLGVPIFHMGGDHPLDVTGVEHYYDADEEGDGQQAGIYTRLIRLPCAPPCPYYGLTAAESVSLTIRRVGLS